MTQDKGKPNGKDQRAVLTRPKTNEDKSKGRPEQRANEKKGERPIADVDRKVRGGDA